MVNTIFKMSTDSEAGGISEIIVFSQVNNYNITQIAPKRKKNMVKQPSFLGKWPKKGLETVKIHLSQASFERFGLYF
ncbi:hypothetical protein GCM10027566_07570 [Arachidicoccus ginsenosidivorans]